MCDEMFFDWIDTDNKPRMIDGVRYPRDDSKDIHLAYLIVINTLSRYVYVVMLN
jgi:hypothetical protein